MNTTFTAGLSAVAGATTVNTLDRVRRSIDAHAEAGRLTAAAVELLVGCCRERAVELVDLERVEPAPAPMTLAASAPAQTATPGIPDGDYTGTITTAGEREWPDSGVVLSVVVAVEVDGEVVDVRARFDAGREIPRKALYRAAGLQSGSDPSMLIGKAVRVTLGTWSPPSGGSPRPVVRRWLAPAVAAPTAPRVIQGNTAKAPKSVRPEWSEDDDAIPF